MDQELHQDFLVQLDRLIATLYRKLEDENVETAPYDELNKEVGEYLAAVRTQSAYAYLEPFLTKAPPALYSAPRGTNTGVGDGHLFLTGWFGTQNREAEPFRIHYQSLIDFLESLKDLLEEAKIPGRRQGSENE
jgi:hypothetical protein